MSNPIEHIASSYDQYDFDGKRDRIIDFAARGYSGVYIAKITGIPERTVYMILKDEYQKRCVNREAIKQSQDQTIKWLKLKITERIHNKESNWARQDAELLLKLMEREAKLHGLDQPVQHNVSVVIEDMSDEDVIKQLRAEGLEIKQLPPAAVMLPEPPAEDAEFVEKVIADQEKVDEQFQ